METVYGSRTRRLVNDGLIVDLTGYERGRNEQEAIFERKNHCDGFFALIRCEKYFRNFTNVSGWWDFDQ